MRRMMVVRVTVVVDTEFGVEEPADVSVFVQSDWARG